MSWDSDGTDFFKNCYVDGVLDVLSPSEVGSLCNDLDWNYCEEQLFAEWLIEKGFMPDPSEFFLPDGRGYLMSYRYNWVCEDKSEEIKNE